MSYEKFGTNDLIIQVYSEQPQSDFGPHRIPRGIRVIHIPTGTVVSCDTDRSQHRNRHLALTELWEKVQGKLSYQELEAERDALVAQVEALRNLFPLKILVACDGFLNYPLSKYNAVVGAFNKTPQQHLREIKAQAVQEFANRVCDECTHDWQRRLSNEADYYAKRVKAGEV